MIELTTAQTQHTATYKPLTLPRFIDKKVIPLTDLPNKQLLYNLVVSCHSSKGVGLAAPQVGIYSSLFVVAIDNTTYNVFINPKFKPVDDKLIAYTEGCLSIPNTKLETRRFSTIECEWLDEDFMPHEEVLTGVSSVVFQHEMDHLTNKSIIDCATGLNRQAKRELFKRLWK